MAAELFAPDPPPPPVCKIESAWIDAGRGGIWGSHGSDKLTRLTLLAHKYRLYAQIQILDTGLRILLLPRNADPQDPAFHPGLSDLVAHAYAVAGKAAPPDLLAQSRVLLGSLLETVALIPEGELTEQEIASITAARNFLERTNP